MANLSEDIQCAGSDNRPPMLDKADFVSWQQRPERPRVLFGTVTEVKEMYNADIRATNIYLRLLLEGSELTKGRRESQLYDDFETSRQNKGETHSQLLCSVCQVLINGHAELQDDNVKNSAELKVIVQNVQGRQNRGQGNSARGAGAVGYGRAQNRMGNANPGQARQVKVEECDAYDSDVDDAPTAQTLFMANLSSADPVYDDSLSFYDSEVLI
ncbi:hypothetical protein Tco_0065875 [Tanacetum coccineum]